jgi:2'-5' RNA ligase
MIRLRNGYTPRVPGIISILDEPAFAHIMALWQTMEREFGAAAGFPGALPHFSYHIAETYDLAAAAAVVAGIAAAQPAVVVETSGFGVFTGAERTIYIPVARNAELASLHGRVCERMRAAGMETAGYYLPERWLPHITIAQQNVPASALPRLLAWLSEQDFSWRLPVTNLAIAEQTPDGATVFERYALGG